MALGKSYVLACLLGAASCLTAAWPHWASAESVTTYHNGINRHGAYVVPGLTAAAAAGMYLDTGFSGTVTGNVYAQPLYWQAKGASVGQVIVATESNVVEALNANTGAVIWQTQLPAPAPLSALGCGNISPEGITGTPAIDPVSGTIYLDAVVYPASGTVRHMVYALSASTGSILPSWPLDVQASLAAKGIAFDSTIQGERGALLLLGGRIYITYGGRSGDCGNYHGMVIEVQPSVPAIKAAWSTRAVRGGIWAQGGSASDGSSIYVTTGNTSGAQSWGDGEAILRLRPSLAHSADTADYYAPANWLALDESDADLGGTEALPLSIPVPGGGSAGRVIAFGKDGNAYLTDRANLGGIGGQIAIAHVSGSRIITAPAVYSSSTATMVAFLNEAGTNCAGNSLSMLTIAPNGTSPISEAWCAPLNGAGAPIVTTTDGQSNPLVWIAGAQGDNLLHGFDALTGAQVYSGGAMTGLRHFVTILAANRHLYVAGTNKVYAFTFK